MKKNKGVWSMMAIVLTLGSSLLLFGCGGGGGDGAASGVNGVISGAAVKGPVNGASGTAWGTGAFRSNGERIYFTSTSERGTAITYTEGPGSGSWMMMGGQLACVSCHGPYGLGGKHNMGMMQVMDAKDIRWKVLQPEFNAEKFRLAVVKGQDPDGTLLKQDMPRWNISNEDLADLIAFLKTLP